jgi:hypothetical protein
VGAERGAVVGERASTRWGGESRRIPGRGDFRTWCEARLTHLSGVGIMRTPCNGGCCGVSGWLRRTCGGVSKSIYLEARGEIAPR